MNQGQHNIVNGNPQPLTRSRPRLGVAMIVIGSALMVVAAVVLVVALDGGWSNRSVQLILAVPATLGAVLLGWGVSEYSSKRTRR